jgi:hypothetical protein
LSNRSSHAVAKKDFYETKLFNGVTHSCLCVSAEVHAMNGKAQVRCLNSESGRIAVRKKCKTTESLLNLADLKTSSEIEVQSQVGEKRGTTDPADPSCLKGPTGNEATVFDANNQRVGTVADFSCASTINSGVVNPHHDAMGIWMNFDDSIQAVCASKSQGVTTNLDIMYPTPNCSGEGYVVPEQA